MEDVWKCRGKGISGLGIWKALLHDGHLRSLRPVAYKRRVHVSVVPRVAGQEQGRCERYMPWPIDIDEMVLFSVWLVGCATNNRPIAAHPQVADGIGS